jgi:transcriptional regulatory protein RtcR
LSEAGRKLYGATREKRKIQNDSDRLRKYLARFDLDWPNATGAARQRDKSAAAHRRWQRP